MRGRGAGEAELLAGQRPSASHGSDGFWAEASDRRMVQDQQAGAPAKKVGASATPERA
jgi:hypothetical protein